MLKVTIYTCLYNIVRYCNLTCCYLVRTLSKWFGGCGHTIDDPCNTDSLDQKILRWNRVFLHWISFSASFFLLTLNICYWRFTLCFILICCAYREICDIPIKIQKKWSIYMSKIQVYWSNAFHYIHLIYLLTIDFE